MSAPIFEHLTGEHRIDWHAVGQHLRHDLDDATDWFHGHHQPQPYDEHQTHQEEPVTLAATSDTLTARTGSLKQALEESAAKLHEALDQHVTGLIDDAAAVADAAQVVESTPVIKSALNAAHVPVELLSPVAAMLDALAAAHPKPAEPQPA